MRKDKQQSSDYCPECVEAEANAETGDNVVDDCCCCCCSCSDSASDDGNDGPSIETQENRTIRTLKKQKEDLLSKLTVLQTNREPTSVQQILQFVEALTHSTDFLRRYNMQQDFCLDCVLSEPTCTCCTSGISQLNINDQHHDSCDECNSNEVLNARTNRCVECSECTPATKESNTGRLSTRNRRDRRQRRRQRVIQHALPRVSATPAPNNAYSSGNSQNQSSSNKDNIRDRQEPRDQSQHQRNETHQHDGNFEEISRELPRNSQRRRNRNRGEILNHDNCEECARASPLNLQRGSNRGREDTLAYDDNCEDCVTQTVPRRGNRSSNLHHPVAHGDSNENRESCEECERENLPSTSCTFSCCEDCESKTYSFGIRQRNATTAGESHPECSSACCGDLRPGNNQTKSNKSKQRSSSRGECNEETCNECSDRRRDDSSACSCEDCQSNTECSDESCDECRYNSNTPKNKKK